MCSTAPSPLSGGWAVSCSLRCSTNTRTAATDIFSWPAQCWGRIRVQLLRFYRVGLRHRLLGLQPYSLQPWGTDQSAVLLFFWGIAAVVWLKGLYPRLSAWIERIPIRWGKAGTWVLIVFMVCNIIISALALDRYTQRSAGGRPPDYFGALPGPPLPRPAD